MSAILAESLGLSDSDLGATARSPPRLHLQVLVNAVLAEQPVALAGVAGQHLPLGREDARDVDDEIHGYRSPVPVPPLQRVDEIKMRDLPERGCGFPLAGRVIRARRREARVADQEA